MLSKKQTNHHGVLEKYPMAQEESTLMNSYGTHPCSPRPFC